MMNLNPNDNVLDDNASETSDSNFGGNRQYTTGTQQKEQDYKKSTGGSINIKKNPVDKTIRDIDDMANSETKKREFSRRAETENPSDHNKEHFNITDSENRPEEDTSGVIEPDNKYHGNRLRYHFGEGQYEGEIS